MTTSIWSSWPDPARAPRTRTSTSTRSPPRSSAAAWRRSASRWRPTCRRTATTPILNQSNERNATILDARGRLAALSVGIPQFMLTSTLPVRFALDFLGVEEFREGDVFVANDPYHGGGHLPDYNVFAPVFADDPATGTRRMVLIASIQCHHGDTGGAVPGGYNVTATDIWGEGVRWPVVKVIDQGVERRDVLYALQANNRLPGLHRRPAGADRRGAARRADGSSEIIARHGVGTVEAVGRLHDRLRRPALPRGGGRPGPTAPTRPTATSTTIPLGNPDIHLHVAITVDGDRLSIDFTGSDDRPELQAWSTFGNTRGYTVAQIAAMMDPGDPEERRLLRVDRARRARRAACSTRRPTGRWRPAPTTRAPRSARSSRWRSSTCCPTRRCRRSTRPACRR